MESYSKLLLAVFLAVAAVINDKTVIATAFKSYCAQKGVKGHCYRDDVRFFCCNGTQIANEIRYISRSEVTEFYHPCQAEISAEVETEKSTLADYLWKLEACYFRKKIGISADSITYEKYVETEVANFTTENDIKSTFINSNKECPEAAKETQFHKKFKAMKNCFSSNLEQECTSKETLKRTAIAWADLKKNMSSSCPHVPGVRLQLSYCCKTESLPYSVDVPLKIQTILPKSLDQSNKCLESIREIGKTEKIVNAGGCRDACAINPVIFEKGSSAPPIDWKPKASLEFLFGFFNISSVKKELLQNAEKILSKAKVAFTKDQQAAKTGFTFVEMETAYKTKPLNEGIFTYCVYYSTINFLATASVYEHCYGSTESEKILNQLAIF